MIDYESKKWINDYREVKAGTVAVTGSGKLRDKGVKQIIHAVGPQWTTVNKSGVLTSTNIGLRKRRRVVVQCSQ